MANILIIEDDDCLLEALSILLTSEGHIVTGASHGKELFSHLNRSMDLILLDYGLPYINGATLAGWIKNDSTYGALPIIMMSANSEALDVAHTYAIDLFLTKPFTMTVLLTQIERLIVKDKGILASKIKTIGENQTRASS